MVCIVEVVLMDSLLAMIVVLVTMLCFDTAIVWSISLLFFPDCYDRFHSETYGISMYDPIDDADATLRSFGFEWKVAFNITVTEAIGQRSHDSYYGGGFVFNFVGMYIPTNGPGRTL